MSRWDGALASEEQALVERTGREGGLGVGCDGDRGLVVAIMIRHRSLLDYVVTKGRPDTSDRVALNETARAWFARRYGYEPALTARTRE